MTQLFKYLSLCFFRNNPITWVPESSFIWKTIVFYLVSGMIVEGLISDPVSGTLEVMMRTVMAFSCIFAILLAAKKWLIFQQLLTAIFVCENFIMTLAMLAEMLDFLMVMNHYEYREEVSIALGVLLVVWYIAIISYVLRQALVYTVTRSIVSSLGYFVTTYGVPMLIMEL